VTKASQGRLSLGRLRAGVWAISIRIPIFAVVAIVAIAMFDVVKVYSAHPGSLLSYVSILESAQKASSSPGDR
jgi:hypothetical protein